MMYRLPEFSIRGDELAFMQHAHVARRVLEVGKWLALGRALPVPLSLHPRQGARAVPAVTGRYVPVTVGGVTYQIYSESAGSGRDVLCMHTAGADGRQFHGLMADPRIVEHHRLVSFDLPWHGKSPPPEDAIQGSWRLNTDLYVALIMGFIATARLKRPVALGASMSGEICLELAYRHPDSFAGIRCLRGLRQDQPAPDHLGSAPARQPGAVRPGVDTRAQRTAQPRGIRRTDHLALWTGRSAGLFR
jgi:pimeloyl-ACP methyl ester carboxylesterase